MSSFPGAECKDHHGCQAYLLTIGNRSTLHSRARFAN
jgi:hypothetical protein